jgi:4a-hydroxytetrahydrobiopterin dehydratase
MRESQEFKKKQGFEPTRRALAATEIIAKMVDIPGWVLDGDGADVAIQKAFSFETYLQAVSFVNAVAFIAERHDHHPCITLDFKRCVVRFNTHDVQGITLSDFECAVQVQALLEIR